MVIGFHYAHGLVEIVLTCYCRPGVSLGVGLGGCPQLLVLLVKENQYSKEHFDSEMNSCSTNACILHQFAKGDHTSYCTARYQLTRRLGGIFYLFAHQDLFIVREFCPILKRGIESSCKCSSQTGKTFPCSGYECSNHTAHWGKLSL